MAEAEDITISYAPLTEAEIFSKLLLKKRDLVTSLGLKWTTESPSDLGMAILRVIAHGLALNSRYTDNRATQGYLIYGIDDEAVHAGCRGIGYKIKGPVASQILLSVTASGAVTLAAGTKVVKTNSAGVKISFETMSDLVFTSAGTKQVYAIQGTTYTKTSTGTNLPFQSLVLDKYPTAAYSIVVLVGGVQWTEVNDFISSNTLSKHYTVEYDYKGQATISFGDGQFGMVPTTGQSIYVAYRTCDGSYGNVAPGTMTMPVSVAKISTITNQAPAEGTLKTAITSSATQVELEDDNSILSFASSGVAYIGDDSFSYTGITGTKFTGVTGLEYAHNPGESVVYANKGTMGIDRESNKKAKLNALRNNRIKTSANSTTDYEYLARKTSNIARAKAICSNNIVTIQVVPADGGIPSSQQINSVLTYLTPRKNARHTVSVVPPKYVYIDVSVVVTPAASYSFTNDVKTSVLETIQDFLDPLKTTEDELFYQNGWGQSIKVSTLIAKLMNLRDGMLISDVDIKVFKRSTDTTGTTNILLAVDEIPHIGKITVLGNDDYSELEPGTGSGMSGVITMPKISAIIG